MRQILGRLGVPESGRVRDDVRGQLRAHAIAEPTLYRRLELDESALRLISASSYSVAEIIRKLGLPVNETNRRRILRSLGRHNIDTSHFRRQLTSAVIKQRALDPQAIMVERPMGSNRIPGSVLLRALIQCGVSLSAGGGTRTPRVLPPAGPKPAAYSNSATPAHGHSSRTVPAQSRTLSAHRDVGCGVGLCRSG